MNRKFTFFFQVSLVVLCLFILYRLYETKIDLKHLNFRIEQKNEQIIAAKSIYYKLNSSVLATNMMEGSLFKPHFTLPSTNQRATLFLRIHENNCNDCVEQTLRQLEGLKENGNGNGNGNVNIIVLAMYPNIESVKSNFKITFPVILFREFEQDLIAKTRPYLFVLENNYMQNVFFPDWEMPELLTNYVKSVKTSIFKIQ